MKSRPKLSNIKFRRAHVVHTCRKINGQQHEKGRCVEQKKVLLSRVKLGKDHVALKLHTKILHAIQAF